MRNHPYLWIVHKLPLCLVTYDKVKHMFISGLINTDDDSVRWLPWCGESRALRMRWRCRARASRRRPFHRKRRWCGPQTPLALTENKTCQDLLQLSKRRVNIVEAGRQRSKSRHIDQIVSLCWYIFLFIFSVPIIT